MERRETEYMRLQRRKVGIDDFEQLTVIGRGAFGEVHDILLYSIITFRILMPADSFSYMQVRLCRAKSTGEIFAMKKLKKSEMLSRGQVIILKLVNYSSSY